MSSSLTKPFCGPAMTKLEFHTDAWECGQGFPLMVGDNNKGLFRSLRAQCEEKRRGYNSKSKLSVRLDCYDVGAFIAQLMYMVSKLSTTCNLLFTLVF